MYEKDGEKYFIVDSHMPLLGREPGELEARPREVRQGLDRVLLRLPPARPARDALDYRAVPEVLDEDDLMKDMFNEGYVDVAIFQPTYLKEWYTTGLQHHRAQQRHGREAPRAVHRQHPLGPP